MAKVLVLPTEFDHVILRELATLDDDKAYFDAQHEDPEHITRFSNTLYESVGDITHDRLNAGRRIWLGIWQEGTLVGKVDAKINGQGTEAEIGYWLRPSATGRGYATAAVRALTAYLRPKYARVYAEVHIANAASIKVVERAGYLLTGRATRDWGPVCIFEPPAAVP